MSLFVIPYKSGSQSAKSLATELGVTLLRKENSKFIGNPSKMVINWGGTAVPMQVSNGTKLVNNPSLVHSASNKQKFFHMLQQYNNSSAGQGFPVMIPEVFYDYNTAMQWWAAAGAASGRVVMARTVVNGHSGEGIVELETAQDWIAFKTKYGNTCKLFSAYKKKMAEYRLHFTDFSKFNSALTPNVFFAQRKAKKIGGETEANFRVRNLANGFVYVTEEGNLQVPDKVAIAAQNFLKMNKDYFGLQFGALDIIYNSKYNKAYVLEVNTAPGLAGTTITKYAEQFNKLRQATGF